ncbi:MAG TPA: tetratricopeptide repeat protein [Pyrinomonadaceae bacterium]|nr:tetratricopeptide repeat protein [Pyrinomonadaceae bacterium]
MIRTHYRLTIVLLAVVIFAFSGLGSSARNQGQAGGGSLPNDPMGGAALIFRRPDNPPVHSESGSASRSAGGGRISGPAKVRAAAVAHERVIAKANAARSAPTPRYSEAEEQYKLAAAQDPNDARAQAGLGNTYLDQGRFNEAAVAYRQALKVRPDYLAVYQPLAYALVRMGLYVEATDTLKQALQYDANNAEIHNNLAFAYVHAGRYAEAVSAAQQAIALLGKTGEAYKQELQIRNEVLSNAYKNLGNAYNELKQYNNAADALKQAAAIEPKNAAAHFNLGLALYNGQRYSEAIEAYKAVIQLKPNLAGAHYNLGLTYVKINDQENARRQHELLKPLNAAMASQLQTLLRR